MSDHYAEEAKRIHKSLPVIDGHNDLPYAIRTKARGSLETADPSQHLPGYHTDIPRLLRGGVGGQFWSVYVPAGSENALRDTLEQIDLVKRIVNANPEHLAVATTAADVRSIRSNGRIACMMGVEGGHSIEDSLGAMRMLRDLGVGYMTLTHNDTLEWADAAGDEPRWGGLNEFGRDVVREMNRIGMIVDISHVAATTMRAALDVTRAPIIASHSSAYALAAHPRNVPDDVLRRMEDNGGVVMVNFYPGFVVPELTERASAMMSASRVLLERLGDDEAVASALADRFPVPSDTGHVTVVVDHIEHIARVAGVDHVGLGSDFDGVDMLPTGLEDVTCYPNITAELLRRGWSEIDVRKVLGENVLRVMDAVAEVAG